MLDGKPVDLELVVLGGNHIARAGCSRKCARIRRLLSMFHICLSLINCVNRFSCYLLGGVCGLLITSAVLLLYVGYYVLSLFFLIVIKRNECSS